MPIDHNIVFRSEQPKRIDVNAAYRDAYDQQNNSLILQQNRMKAQQQREEQEDVRKIKDAYIESNGDSDKWIESARKKGVHPSRIMAIEKDINARKEAAMNMDEKSRKALIEKNDVIRGIMSPVEDEKDNAKAAKMYEQAKWVAKQRGLLDDKTAETLDKMMPDGFDRDLFKIFMGSLTTGSKLASEAEKELRAQAAWQRAQNYAADLEQKMRATDFKNDTDRMRAKAYVENIERLILKDENIDEYNRLRLQDTTARWKAQLDQRSEEEQGRNYLEYGPEMSRGWRALKLWMTLRALGAGGLREALTNGIAMARHLHGLVQAHPDFAVLHDPLLYLYCFRYVPRALAARAEEPEVVAELDRLNQAAVDTVQASGLAFLMTTRIHGRVAIRLSICSQRTTVADIDRTFNALAAAAESHRS